MRLRKEYKVASSTVSQIGKFGIRIMGPAWTNYIQDGMNDSDAFRAFDDANQRVVDDFLGGTLSDVEAKISDLLPDGYYCKIES